MRTLGVVLSLVAALAGSRASAQTPAGKNCVDIRDHLGATDGLYLIEPVTGVQFTVYCYDMPTTARAYLPLVRTGGAYNYSQYTVGGAVYGETVKTSFTMVRIDPGTLRVDIGDTTFATSTGSLTGANGVVTMAYAAAADCAGYNSATGIANVDFTGTPFVVDNTIFYTGGWYPAGSVKVGSTTTNLVPFDQTFVVRKARIIEVRGGGYCGSAGPFGLGSQAYLWANSSPGQWALQLKFVGP